MLILTSRGSVEIADHHAEAKNPQWPLMAVLQEANRPEGCCNPGTELVRTGVPDRPFLTNDYILWQGIWRVNGTCLSYDADNPCRGVQHGPAFFETGYDPDDPDNAGPDADEFRDGFFDPDDCE